jgi:hypothetical protein
MISDPVPDVQRVSAQTICGHTVSTFLLEEHSVQPLKLSRARSPSSKPIVIGAVS